MDFLKILVPVVGGAVAFEAVKLACKLIDTKAQGMVSIVHVIAVERTLPIDTALETEIERAEGVLESMENIAREKGCAAESELLQARDVAQAIVDEAAARKVDLIVLGTPYKIRFGQFSLGDIVPHVLKYAPCHVMLFQHKPAAA